MNDLMIKIVAGLLTAFVIYLIRKFGWPKLTDKLTDRFQNVTDFSAKWIISYDENGDNIGSAIVEQSGQKVSAKVEITKNRNGEDVDKSYKAKGHVYGGEAVLIWEDEKNPGYLTGSFVLTYSPVKEQFCGKTTHKVSDEQVESLPIYLRRP